MIKLVVWDWNGTLLNDLDVCFDILKKSMRKWDLNPIENKEMYKSVFRFPVVEMYKDLGFDCSGDKFSSIADHFMENYLEDYKKSSLHPDAYEVLGNLQKKGIQNVLLSASKKEILDEQTEYFECQKYFEKRLGIEDIYARSKKELALKWIETCDIDPSEILWIGDSTHDYECANACGVHCVLVQHGHQDYIQLSQTDARIFSNLKEIEKLLENFQ